MDGWHSQSKSGAFGVTLPEGPVVRASSCRAKSRCDPRVTPSRMDVGCRGVASVADPLRLVFCVRAAQGAIVAQIGGLIGVKEAAAIQAMIASASNFGS